MILIPDIVATYRGLEAKTFRIVDNIKYNNVIDIFALSDLEFLKQIKDNIIIITNFTICKPCIIESLFLSGKHQQTDKKDKDLCFQVYGDYIEIYFDKSNRYILSSYEKKFMQNYDSDETALLLEAGDNIHKPTCAQTAKAEFMEKCFNCKNEFINRNLFKRMFHEPMKDEFKHLKRAKDIVVPFMYLKKAGVYNNIYSYDKKSSFPSQIYNSVFPIENGKNVKSLNEIPEKKWFVAEIRIYTVRIKKYDFYGLMDKYLENLRQPFTIDIDSESLKAIEELYDIDYNINQVFYYKLKQSIFDEFFYNNINISNKYLRKYGKAKNNTLIGSFGANDEITTYKYILKEDKLSYVSEYDKREHNAYYPMYLYVNGKAKAEFCRICNKFFDNLIYANTDGLMLDTYVDMDIVINESKYDNIGRYELRQYYLEFAAKEVSNYSAIYADDDGEIKQDLRLSGRTRIFQDVPHETFKNGGFKSVTMGLSKYGFVTPIEFEEEGIQYYINIGENKDDEKRA